MPHCYSTRKARTIAALSFAFCCLLDPGGVHAGERHTTASTQAIGQPSQPQSCFHEDFASTGRANSPCSSTAGAGSGTAIGTAGFKSVKVLSSSSKHLGTVGGHGDGYATASSTEKLTFSTTQAAFGETMLVEIALEVDGDISGSATCGQGQTSWEAGGVLTLYYGENGLTQEFEVARGEFDNDPNSPNDTFETGPVNVQLLWANGVDFDFMMHGFAWSNITALGACTGVADSNLGNTFTWNGVVSVADSKGNPITEYTLVDEFGNDWTTPPSVADINIDGVVNVDDLLAVINAWGECPQPCPPSCGADIAPSKGDCIVNVDDLLMVINSWGG
jgi:hypothetical protein